MKLSLILPVYNVEKYLAKCIDSCLNQDIPHDEYEIIIVIDGATDNSLQVALRYEAKYGNVNVIEQENRGLSGARNTGLRAAQGEYVWFIDSDDWIKKNCLKKIVKKIQVTKADTIVINFFKQNQKGESEKSSSVNMTFNKDRIYTGHQYFAKRAGDFLNAWRYISKIDFLKSNELSFLEGIIHEDNEFTPRLLYFANTVAVILEPLYGHLIREGSIMTSYNPNKIDSFITIFDSLSEFKRKVSSEIFYRDLNLYLLQMLSNYLQNRHKYFVDDKSDIKKIKAIDPIDFDKKMTFKNQFKYLMTKYIPLTYSRKRFISGLLK